MLKNKKIIMVVLLFLLIFSIVSSNAVITHNNILSCDCTFNENSENYFTVNIIDDSGNPCKNTKVIFTISGKNYTKYTNSYGLAKLKINKKEGTYKITTKSLKDSESNTIKVQNTDTLLKTTDMVMTKGENKSFESTLTNKKGNYIKNATIKYKIFNSTSSKTYTVKTNKYGYSSLKLKLNPGNYTIETTFPGNSEYKSKTVKNIITVNKPLPAVVKHVKNNIYFNFRSLYTTNMGLGQDTSYWCSCNALQQSFYHLTGKKVTESTISSWMGGIGRNGAGHDQINVAVEKFNKKYNTKIKIKWITFSGLGRNRQERFDALGDLLCRENTALIVHDMYRYNYGHYESLENINPNRDVVYVLNSLGYKRNSHAYAGYLEYRSYSDIAGYSAYSPAYSSIGVLTC